MIRRSIFICCAAFCLWAFPQYSQRPRFEAVSVKLVSPVPGGTSLRSDPSRIDYKQVFLKELIRRAFELPAYQIIWPHWLDVVERGSEAQAAYYDISATLPPSTSTSLVPLMLQDLLIQRFHLSSHREERDVNVYAMTIGPNGLRIPRSEIASTNASHNVYRVNLGSPEARIVGHLTLAALANSLRNEVERPLVDMTGLDDDFEIDLRWAHDVVSSGAIGSAGLPSLAPGANNSELFSAMAKQLGIRVEAQRVKLQMMIVDHIDRVPTEN